MKIISFILILNLFSQIESDIARKSSLLSQKIRTQIEETLGLYFKPETFFVDVKVNLIKPEPIRIQQKIIPKTEKLPGLPAIIKEEIKEETIPQYEGYKIEWMKITILLRHGIFTTNDISFIKQIVQMRSGFDDTRGDSLEIKQVPFPQLESLTKEKQKFSFTELLAKIPTELSFGIIIVLLVLLLILILQFSLLKKIKYPTAEHPVVEAKPVATPVPASTPPPAPPSAKKSIDTVISETKKYLVSLIVGSPQICSKISKKWITEGDEGLNRISIFYKTVDSELLNLLEEYFERDVIEKINSKIPEVEIPEPEKLLEIWNQFRKEYTDILKSEKVKAEVDIFQFLHQLQPHQILHIIKDEPPGVVAIVIGQLDPDIAINVFKELPLELQKKIPFELGKLKKIPVGAFKDIAERLSRKAYDAAQIKFVTTDGVEALVGLLERMDPESEKEVLSTINEQDITLGEEIRKVYLTFADILKVPDKVLTEVVRPMERESVAKALIGADEQIQNKILKCLPERIQIIVKDLIESLIDTPREEVEKSRLIIIREIRTMAREGKINLKKILEGGV